METADAVDRLDIDGPVSTNRQEAVRAVAAGSDLVLLVGSVNSSNSQRSGTEAYLIDDASELDPGLLVGVKIVGLTAGASTSEMLGPTCRRSPAYRSLIEKAMRIAEEVGPGDRRV
ncbi:hypothetical protein [Amycolatopsis sp. NPDC049868]|uniref:hypothetical protein n=1 Tax=Amycolatopsis sp. NPDC049868 TaxID=3363934 RepID=UPI0037B449DC